MTPRKKMSIRVTVVFALVVLTLIMVSIAIGLQYHFSRKMATEYALEQYQLSASATLDYLKSMDKQTIQLTKILSRYPGIIQKDWIHPNGRPVFAEALKTNPLLYAIYIGFSNGDFYELVNLDTYAEVRSLLNAAPDDRWVEITVRNHGTRRMRQFDYYNDAFVLRTTRKEPSDYDARKRLWFTHASEQTVYKTQPYLFHLLQAPGQTYAIKMPGTRSVLAIDITFSSLSKYISALPLSRESEIYLYQSNGQINASNQKALPQKKADDIDPIHKTVPYSRLIEIAGQKALENKLHKTVINGEDHFIFVTLLDPDPTSREYFAVVVPSRQILADCLEKLKTSILITIACMILLLPICWLFATPVVNPIKRLAAENRKIKHRQYDQVTLCSSVIKEIHDLAISLVDMSEAIQQHEQQQADLMDAVIQTIARAIDDKSPYTGQHCARVPELALMMVRAADRSNTPPFDRFSFHSKDQLREFQIGAWLHDCGKIITPEHIMNKGTKLETIYNRIHEIRMRFEVLWRDAQIQTLEKKLAEPEKNRQWEEELADTRQTLQTDFSFIAGINIGAEKLSEADLERIKTLAAITWERHFDDRLGLSPQETSLYPDPPSALPATEHLLSDQPWHLIPHPTKSSANRRPEIKMSLPAYDQNLGEIHNLSIPSGTLTPEERYKINGHVISTLRMLEQLPFPKEMTQIPRYAATHHEVLNGTGYPRQLTAKDLSLPERIIGVADIFEALTAADRPYKKAKKISEALEILQDMVKKNLIDGDVFDLFLTSGVCMEYARRYLAPELIDVADVSRYLSQSISAG